MRGGVLMANVVGCPAGAFFRATVITILPPTSLFALIDWMVFDASFSVTSCACATSTPSEAIITKNRTTP
jgi:hypothetical protein